MSKSNKLDSNIQTNTTGRLTPCLQKKIDKTTYLIEVHFPVSALWRPLRRRWQAELREEIISISAYCPDHFML